MNKDLQLRTKKAQKAVLEALVKTMGVVSPAIESVDVSRTQYYLWLNEDPKFKAKVDEMPDRALDFVESKLYQLIDGGHPAAIIFYLKTKGKHRGYIEEYTGNANIQINIIEPDAPGHG